MAGRPLLPQRKAAPCHVSQITLPARRTRPQGGALTAWQQALTYTNVRIAHLKLSHDAHKLFERIRVGRRRFSILDDAPSRFASPTQPLEHCSRPSPTLSI